MSAASHPTLSQPLKGPLPHRAPMQRFLVLLLVVPAVASSGCIQMCEVRGDCWALWGIYAYADLHGPATADDVARVFRSLGYEVNQMDPYVQGTNVTGDEIVTLRLSGAALTPAPTGTAAGTIRLCIQYGDWSHHDSHSTAETYGHERRAELTGHAESVMTDFSTRVGRSLIGTTMWETHMYDQGQAKAQPIGDGYECI